MNLKTKTVCLIDSGNFISWVDVLKKEFGRILFYNPCESQFPISEENRLGTGIEGVEVVNALVGDRRGVGFFDILDEIDLFIFPDVGRGDLQGHLRRLGKRVWGSGHGDDLELFRWECKQFMEQVGLPVHLCRRIIGVKALREYLESNEDKWIKISGTRGDQESFHHSSMEETNAILNRMVARIGIVMDIMEFVVEDPIDPAVELGYDGFNIDGQFPAKAMQGIEVKDEGYACAVVPYASFPWQVRVVNERLSPLLKRYQYRNDFCTEIRVPKSLEPHLIDVTARKPSPPNELSQLLISNWCEIFWYGAEGVLVQPIYTAAYGAQAIIYSSWAENNPQVISFPDAIKENVKLKNYVVVNGAIQIMPQPGGLCEIGSVVATGKSLIEAVQKCREAAKEVQGHGLKIRLDSLPKSIQEFQKAEEFGVQFKGLNLPTQEELSQALL